jgi:predicted nuclease of restriction endonuclease-like RecB superfamily
MELIDSFKIEKREKSFSEMPSPDFKDNWKQEMYEKNVKDGVQAMQKGKEIRIYDDGRGYELALEIKRNYMLEYQKRLSEKIKIDKSGDLISISFNPLD